MNPADLDTPRILRGICASAARDFPGGCASRILRIACVGSACRLRPRVVGQAAPYLRASCARAALIRPDVPRRRGDVERRRCDVHCRRRGVDRHRRRASSGAIEWTCSRSASASRAPYVRLSPDFSGVGVLVRPAREVWLEPVQRRAGQAQGRGSEHAASLVARLCVLAASVRGCV